MTSAALPLQPLERPVTTVLDGGPPVVTAALLDGGPVMISDGDICGRRLLDILLRLARAQTRFRPGRH